jgi:hypothetical protein
MKIAVCLTGQPRHLRFSLPTIKSNLIDENYADVFVHTWWDEKLDGTLFDSSQPQQIGIVGKWNKADFEMVNTLNAKNILVENPRSFPESNSYKTAPTAKQDSLSSKYYAQYKVKELLENYEKEHGFEYDIIIKARIDLCCKKPVNVSTLTFEDGTLILASKWQDGRQGYVPGLGDYTMDDNIAIGKRKDMKIYLNVFPNMKTLNSKISPPFAENYLGWHCRNDHGLKIKTFPFDIDIAHRLINYQYY